MASTTDYDFITSKTYKATRPNGSEMFLDDEDDLTLWLAPITDAAGSGWGSNFRNLKVQSVTINGHFNYSKGGEVRAYLKPYVVYNAKTAESGMTVANIKSYFLNVSGTIGTDLFAEDMLGSDGTASADPDKFVGRAIIKGEVLVGTDAWMEFTATFYNDKVMLSNYNTQGVIGTKVDTYLETLDGYKTEA